MPRSKKQQAEKLEADAALNYATATHLIQCGASEDYVKELRDRADQWVEQAKKLREKARGKA